MTEYTATINDDDSVCRYIVVLWWPASARQIDHDHTATRWGARMWARQRARKHQRSLKRPPYHEEYKFNA